MTDKAAVVRKDRLGRGLAALAAELQQVETHAVEVRALLYSQLLDAYEAGYSYKELGALTRPLGADEAGLTEVRIGQILKEERERRAA